MGIEQVIRGGLLIRDALLAVSYVTNGRLTGQAGGAAFGVLADGPPSFRPTLP